MMKRSGPFTDWCRYHGKCLKIARGKVKQDDTFTCPICDWQVKIPRDAARPKLEDLQAWQDEIPNLPFQPEEEDILERIIDKAQSFRDFLQQYTSNNICRTSEEMPTLLFYLRKLEGAEVLLAYETNIFRQELHKWQPIAPHPPPVIETSLSTRKPRPTKQQKLMAQMGITNPDDLPANLRAKNPTKRKSVDPHMRQPPPLQPAQQSRSDTPQGAPRQASTGNAPNGYDPHYSHTYSPAHHRSGSPPLFSPQSSVTSLRDPLIGAATTNGSLDSGLFSPGFRMEDDIRTGLAGSSRGSSGVVQDNPSPPVHHSGSDDLFAEMTNHVDADRRDRERDGDDQDEDTRMTDTETTAALAVAAAGVAGLEHETSQASEALDQLKSSAEDAGEDGGITRGDGGDGADNSAMDEFLVT